MNTPTPIHIVIADDHRMFAQGLQAILEDIPAFKIGACLPNGKALLAHLESLDPPADVVLMDISMPEMDGLEATARLKGKWPQTSVIVLTMHKEPGLVRKILEAGADGFVLKNTGKAELETAIRTVARGDTYYSKEVIDTIMHSFRFPNETPGPNKIKITRREREVLQLIVQEKTAQEIADALCISQHTVDSHRKNLLSKLGVRNTAGLVKYALRHGLAE
ncbi:MAG: response regulator transcription factor [Bacteroidota bacterium]